MRIAISNIAWDINQDEAVAELLQQFKIDAIDIAPSKYFANFIEATDTKIITIKNTWAERGIEITGMQSLLYGTTGLNLFGSLEIQKAMLQHLNAVCRIGSLLGATRLVFGSPKNRNREGLNDEQVLTIAVPFFEKLAGIASSHGVIICLEANPSCYGSNFMMTTQETAHIVQSVNHHAIKMQLDTGAVTINNEAIEQVLKDYSSIIGHIHLSELNLVPLGTTVINHNLIAQTIAQYLPNHIATIEMLASSEQTQLQSIQQALATASQYYQQA